MKKLLIAILITISTPSTILAEDISVDDLLGDSQDEQLSQNIEDEEEKRLENIENELGISIPEYTDNPSHIIVFKDPSEDKVGVELDIDESGYKDINSPYSLPSLGIGKHKLKFRFVDSIGATKVVEYDLVVIPRPPILKAPTFQENNLVLSGTGLANSEVVVTVSVGASNYTQITDIDSEGNWNASISPDSIINGIYTVFAYTRKSGYASNPSEPAVMEYGSEGVIENSGKNKRVYFDFSEIEFDNIPNIISENPDLLITVASSLILGGLIASLVFLLLKRTSERKDEQEVSEKINGKPKEEKTLMEMFGEEEKNDNKKKKKKVKKEKNKEKNRKGLLFWKNKDKGNNKKKVEKKEDKKTDKKDKNDDKKKKVKEKTFTKRDFLKDFKKFDPDTEEGKENKQPTEKEKKDLIVTLTSKVD